MLLPKQRWSFFALFVFFWLLYQGTLSHQYTYDGLCYALDVEFGTPSQFFHANHLLYAWAYRGLYRFSQIFGYSGRAIYLMQSLNAFVGAGAVSILGWIVSRRFGLVRGLLGAAFLGVSNAFWSETTDPGCYAVACLASCLLLELLLQSHRLKPLWIGLVHGVLVLFHQMLVLVAPAFLVQLAPPRKWALYGVGLSLGAALPYALIARLYHGGSLGEAVYWALGPAGPAPGTKILSRFWWSLDLLPNAVKAWTGLAQSVVAQGLGLHLLLALGLLAVVGWSIRHRAFPALWIWVLVLNLFQFFFYAGTPRYRILFLPPLLFIAAAASRGVKIPKALLAAWTALIAVALVNYTGSISPRTHPGPDAVRTAWVKEQVSPSDFFLFAGRGPASIVNVYMAYFAPQVPARSMWGYLFLHPEGPMDELTQRVQATRRAGGRVFVEKDLLERAPGGAVQRWLQALRPLRAKKGPDGYDLVQVIPVFQAR